MTQPDKRRVPMKNAAARSRITLPLSGAKATRSPLVGSTMQRPPAARRLANFGGSEVSARITQQRDGNRTGGE